MGTSNKFGGPGSSTPLIPSWLPTSPVLDSPPGEPVTPSETPSSPAIDPKAPLPSVPPPATTPDRFRAARTNFTRFAKSGDQGSLSRALGHYVRTGSGGRKVAAMRMGSSKLTASKLASFVGTVQASGATAALAQVHLGDCVGKPASEVLPQLMELFCPAGGDLDEGIAREAFTQATVDLCVRSDILVEELTPDAWRDFFLDFIARSIEMRVINDIGMKGVTGPKTLAGAESAAAALHNLIIAGVRQTVGDKTERLGTMTAPDIGPLVQTIYEAAFGLWEQFTDE